MNSSREKKGFQATGSLLRRKWTLLPAAHGEVWGPQSRTAGAQGRGPKAEASVLPFEVFVCSEAGRPHAAPLQVTGGGKSRFTAGGMKNNTVVLYIMIKE